MNPYRSVATTIGTREAIELAHRLAAWHDAMVVHQRRSGASRADDCESDCPHVEAGTLWVKVLDVFGDRAHELGFLRAHGMGAVTDDPRDRYAHA